MAALLSVFHPVPPIIRRRAKELLDAIRDSVKGALAAATTTETNTEADLLQESVDIDMSASEKPSVVVAKTSSKPTTSLWSSGESIQETEHAVQAILTDGLVQ